MSVRSASTPPEVSSCTDLQVVVKRCWPKLWPITPQVGPHISQRPQCRVYLYEVIFFFLLCFRHWRVLLKKKRLKSSLSVCSCLHPCRWLRVCPEVFGRRPPDGAWRLPAGEGKRTGHHLHRWNWRHSNKAFWCSDRRWGDAAWMSKYTLNFPGFSVDVLFLSYYRNKVFGCSVFPLQLTGRCRESYWSCSIKWTALTRTSMSRWDLSECQWKSFASLSTQQPLNCCPLLVCWASWRVHAPELHAFIRNNHWHISKCVDSAGTRTGVHTLHSDCFILCG